MRLLVGKYSANSITRKMRNEVDMYHSSTLLSFALDAVITTIRGHIPNLYNNPVIR